MTAWKDLERRVCTALGGRRGGPLGAQTSDCVGVPFAVECKRSSRPGPPVLSKWIQQARACSKIENKPWLVVVAGHNDRQPICALAFRTFVLLLAEKAELRRQLAAAHDQMRKAGLNPISAPAAPAVNSLQTGANPPEGPCE